MGLESSLWQCFKGALPDSTHVVRIENRVEVGTPDVNGCHSSKDFWIELKVADKPKLASTHVAVDHFTAEQRCWLFDRWAAGGNAWLLLQVGRCYLLLDGDVAAVLVGYATFEALASRAVVSTTVMPRVTDYITGSRR